MSSAFNSGISDSYLEGPPRQVPGFDGVQRMVEMLLAESVPGNGNILVHGAGGGLELRHLADAQPGWTFHGVDPSKEMLTLAEKTNEQHLDRITLHHGYIETADEGPFDGATSLLTFHFIPQEERLSTLRQLHSRLKRGAPLVLMHISFPQEEPQRSRWIRRHVAYGGASPENMEKSIEAISTRLSILAPEDEESLLTQAGFMDIQLFYAGLSFRGWLAYAG